MAIISSTINYLDGETVLEAFIAYDNAISGQRPTVLIAHAWAGRDNFVAEKARKLAELGYLVFALDMYGKGILGSSIEENAALMQPFIEDRQLLQQRINAALLASKQLPWSDNSKIAAIGFCFGGLCVLDLARSGADIQGVLSFHGLLNAPENTANQPISAKVLMLHGHDDPMSTAEQVSAIQQEFTNADVDWQIHQYGQTQHAFTNPQANDASLGTVYQPIADKRSWQAMQNFLTEVFE